MGTRYFLTVTCPKCKYTDLNVLYAPTCEIVEWKCPECGTMVDLAEYSGVSYEEASNQEGVKRAVEEVVAAEKGKGKVMDESDKNKLERYRREMLLLANDLIDAQNQLHGGVRSAVMGKRTIQDVESQLRKLVEEE